MRMSRIRTSAAVAVVLLVAASFDLVRAGQKGNPTASPENPAPPLPSVNQGQAEQETLSIVAVSSSVSPPPAERVARTARPIRPLDVVAGDELALRLGRPGSSNARFEARFKESATELRATDAIEPAWRLEDGTLVTRVPAIRQSQDGQANLWPVRYLEIDEIVGSTRRNSSNSYPLRIAPPSAALVTGVSATQLTFGSSLRITGEGFFAPPDQIILKLGEISTRAERVSPSGEWFSAVIPHDRDRTSKGNSLLDNLTGDKYDAGPRTIAVTVWGIPATIDPPGDTETAFSVSLQRPVDADYSIELFAAVASATTAGFVCLLIWVIFRTLKRPGGIIRALLLDPESQTYSLSRAQFFWWLAVIALGYIFVFFAHGIHQGNWNFPPLQGFAFTFVISLGTLLVAQATTAVRGSKGAGVVHPSASDLIVHGGVLAPERVQQVVWTLLTSLGFLWIVVKTHATSEGLPEMPTELLALMGLSSAGYLGGKLARKPGPVIQRVEISSGSVILKIFGQHLSVTPRVLVDGVEFAREKIEPLELDPDHPNEFLKAIKVTVPDITTDEWYSKARLVVLINADTQRAEWQLEVPTVTSIEVGDADASGRRVVTVMGKDIGTGGVLLVPVTNEEAPLTPAVGNPTTQWTVPVRSWPTTPKEVIVRGTNQGLATYMWKPAGNTVVPSEQPDQVEQQLREGDQAAEDTGTAKGQ